jgi:hypothetical protein
MSENSSLKAYKKREEAIMKATNNGKCWWLYQWIIGNLYFYRDKNK